MENVECFGDFSRLPSTQSKRAHVVPEAWSVAWENVEVSVPAVFAPFLREEKKRVAFCEYEERRIALRRLKRGRGER